MSQQRQHTTFNIELKNNNLPEKFSELIIMTINYIISEIIKRLELVDYSPQSYFIDQKVKTERSIVGYNISIN